jgi:hypothetical protein
MLNGDFEAPTFVYLVKLFVEARLKDEFLKTDSLFNSDFLLYVLYVFCKKRARNLSWHRLKAFKVLNLSSC